MRWCRQSTAATRSPALTEHAPRAEFRSRGWARADHLDGLDDWLAALRERADTLIHDPENAKWLRAGGSWYAGVNLLDNGPDGACPGGPPLPQSVLDFVAEHTGLLLDNWDAAQLSVVYPGYPRPDFGESDSSYRYRLKRDAAHVDGLHPVGPERRRHANEYHAFVLGLPWHDAPPGASPLAVWESSHHLIRDALTKQLGSLEPQQWREVDLTEAYQAARAAAFEQCERIELSAPPGGAYLVHRLAVHGISPWRAAGDPELRRAVCYFRPALPDPGLWLSPDH